MLGRPWLKGGRKNDESLSMNDAAHDETMGVVFVITFVIKVAFYILLSIVHEKHV